MCLAMSAQCLFKQIKNQEVDLLEDYDVLNHLEMKRVGRSYMTTEHLIKIHNPYI